VTSTAPTSSLALGPRALGDMRTRRRKNRIQDLEWFDALYRVYLAAFVGGGVIMFLSGLIGDQPLQAQEILDVTTHTPHVVGLVAAVVVLLGLRSGAHGGPIAIEEAEVRHVLMAPVARSTALRNPAVQRLRSFVFVGAIAGGVANQLLERRITDASAPMIVFIIWGAVAGGIIGALFVVSALLSHSFSFSQAIATTLGGLLVALQAMVLFTNVNAPGPFDFVGSVSMWWLRVHYWDLVGIAVVIALAVLAIVRVGSLSLEALARRSALVSQMKFAVTLQDLRTVVLLRRQLSQEHMRTQPWLRLPRTMGGDVVVIRGLRSFLRFPLRRLLRMATLSGVAGYLCVVAWNGTTPALVAAGLLLFIVGLDVVEPLSQEIDQPDRTDSFPRERGLLLTKHLIVPAITAVPFVKIGVIAAFIARPEISTLGYGTLLGFAAGAGAVAGAALNSVSGAPDPAGSATAGLALPPEMSGMGTLIRGALPPAITVVACLPLLAVRESVASGNELLNALRAVGAVALLIFLVGGWIRQRDAIRTWYRTAAQQANDAKKKPSTSPSQGSTHES
jgi:hypothetical protein